YVPFGKGPVHFRASIPEDHVLPTLIGRFVESVLGGSAEPLVAYFAGSEKLSAKDLETLRVICRKIDKEPRSTGWARRPGRAGTRTCRRTGSAEPGRAAAAGRVPGDNAAQCNTVSEARRSAGRYLA